MRTVHATITRLGVVVGLALVPWLGAPVPLGAQWLRSPAGVSAPRRAPAGTDTAGGGESRSLVIPTVSPESRAIVAAGPRRSPILAGFLGILPGLGHAYAGEPKRALLVAGVWLGSGLVMFGSSEKVVTGVAAGVNIGSYVFSIADAALAAQRFNRRHGDREGP